MRTPSPSKAPRLAVAAAALFLLTPALTACGSGQDDAKSALPSIASSPKDDQTGDQSPDDGANPSGPSEAEARDAFAKFEDCLTAHGLAKDGATNGATKEQSDLAFAACEPILQKAGVQKAGGGEPPAEMKDQMLAMAKCLRDEGLDVPDPTFDNSGRVQMQVPAGDGAEAAMQKCQQKVGMKMGMQ